MKRIDLNSTSELLNHIDLSHFPLVNHYLDYDDCYMDDNWIKYSIYYDEKDTPVAEVTGGMLNAIGLQNPGIETFCERDLPFLRQYDTKVIVNVCGHAEEEYLNVVDRLAEEKGVDLLEINISCPNVKEGGISFGTDPKGVEHITKVIKEHATQTLCGRSHLAAAGRHNVSSRRQMPVCPNSQPQTLCDISCRSRQGG